MNRFKWAALAVLSFGVVASANVFAQDAAKQEKPDAQPMRATIDKPVKDFKLVDLAKELKEDEKEDAKLVKLAEFKDKKPVVLFFMSEKCSVTWRYEKRLGDLMAKYGKKDVAFMGVRCSAGDTEESIVKFADSKNFDFPVLNDAKGEITEYFKIRNTPVFVLLDKKGVLRYQGSFDDNAVENGVTKKYLSNAVAAVLAGKEVADKQTRPFG